MFLIDTCVLSELSRPRPNPGVLTCMGLQQDLVVCAVTLQELAYVVKRKGSQKLEAWFSELLPELNVLPITKEVSLLSGEIQARLEKSGHQMADADAMIAATACTTGRILVTRNIKEFADCPLTLKNPFS